MTETQADPAGVKFTTRRKDTYPAIDPVSKSNLGGKNVFITGASKGIGLAIAIASAKAGAAGIGGGARSDLSKFKQEVQDAAKQAGKTPPKVLAVQLDITDRSSIENAAKEVQASFGRLDILINNAGYLEEGKLIADSDPDEWWRTHMVNVRGPYLVTRSFLPLVLEGGDKQIVNIVSAGAHVVFPTLSGYQMSKLAVVRFTEFIMAEYGEQGVVSYAVHPGGVLTDMGNVMPKHMHEFIFTDTLELPADTITYLMQERREWLAGRYVSCQWDMPELFAKKDEIIKRDLLKVRLAL